MIWLCKTYTNLKKVYKQFFLLGYELVKNLGIDYYNNNIKKNINKWILFYGVLKYIVKL